MNMNSGYYGYSMSNRAVDAYESGEMPLSKWTKREIIDAIEEIAPDKAKYFKKVKLPVLKDKLLRLGSWHHTSKMCNKTDFYYLDEAKIESMSIEEIISLSEVIIEKETPYRFKGSIKYLEWSGTRRHPKAKEKLLEDVNIELRGCFYVVTNNAGKEILRKKQYSNGTFIRKNNSQSWDY